MIGINSRKIWGVSRRRLIQALGGYYTTDSPAIVFDLCKPETRDVVDKVLMNQKLDRLQIPHPITYYYPFTNMPNTSEQCVIKRRFGSRGNHQVFTTFDGFHTYFLDDNCYVQKYIRFDKEYRVGVDFKRVLGIREKIPNNRHCKIWNSKSCQYITRKDLPELENFALKVARQFNLDLTGIDIGLYKEKYIVIELNSQPTIGKIWAKKIKNDLLERLC